MNSYNSDNWPYLLVLPAIGAAASAGPVGILILVVVVLVVCCSE